MASLVILLISYGLLFVTFPLSMMGWISKDEVHNLLLLSGSFSNAILLFEAVSLLSQNVGRRHKDMFVLYTLLVEWFFVATVIAVDVRELLRKLPVGEELLVVFAAAVVVVALISLITLDHRTTVFVFVIVMAVLIDTLILPRLMNALAGVGNRVAAGFGSALDVSPDFILSRYRAWLHLLMIPLVYLVGDVLTKDRNSVARDSIGLDLALMMVGVAAAAAGIAVGRTAKGQETHFFEEGAAAVLLILGNHAFLVHHKRGFVYGYELAKDWFAETIRWARRSGWPVPRGGGDAVGAREPAPPVQAAAWSAWALRLWEEAFRDWTRREPQENYFREHCVEPVLAGMITGVYSGRIRVVDLGCSDAKNLATLATRLGELDVEVRELVCIDRLTEFIDAAKHVCEEGYQLECETVNLDLCNSMHQLKRHVPTSEYPTVYLAQYVLQEIPAIRGTLDGLAAAMKPRDRLVIVLPHEGFVRQLFDKHAPKKTTAAAEFLAELRTVLPHERDRDWDWAGLYPLWRGGHFFSLPHFERPLRRVKTFAEQAKLEVQGEAYVVVEQTPEAERAFAGVPYADLFYGKPSAVVLVLRKAGQADGEAEPANSCEVAADPGAAPATRSPADAAPSERGGTDHTRRARLIALVTTCVLMNLGLGGLIALLKFPFYLDSIGIILATRLGGKWAGAAVAVLSVTIGSAYSPTLWAYAGTALLVVGCTHWFTRWGYLRSLQATVLFGLVLGVVCAIASAPVTVLVWEGASLTGADFVTAFFAATGRTLAQSVLLGGLATDPVDKLITSLVAFAIIQRLPGRWTAEREALRGRR